MYEPLCCERVEVSMGEYLEATLPRPLRLRVESHLTVCVDCWKELQKYRCTIACLAVLPRNPMPPDLKDRILAAVPSHPVQR
jgi:anti-sigma factor RsiW